jgi:ElaB/YqjD/DUF883 family membrane-anchored ribosome-binding protein
LVIHEFKKNNEGEAGMANSENNVSNDMDVIREDLTSLRNDLSSLMSDIASGGAHAAHAARATAASDVDKAKSTFSAACDQSKELHERANKTVSAHPLTSLLIAAGVGAIAARVFLRRGK